MHQNTTAAFGFARWRIALQIKAVIQLIVPKPTVYLCLCFAVNVNRLKDFAETKRNEMLMERQMMENVKKSGHDTAEKITVSVTSGQCHQWSVSPVVNVTSGQCHQWSVSPVVNVTSGQCHQWSMSPVVNVTSGQCHQWSMSPVVSVTSGQCHQWSVSPVV